MLDPIQKTRSMVETVRCPTISSRTTSSPQQASDIINEAANWTKGRPKKIVRTYLGNKNPEAALKSMWTDLDLFYGLKTTSIEERVKTFSKGPKFERDD